MLFYVFPLSPAFSPRCSQPRPYSSPARPRCSFPGQAPSFLPPDILRATSCPVSARSAQLWRKASAMPRAIAPAILRRPRRPRLPFGPPRHPRPLRPRPRPPQLMPQRRLRKRPSWCRRGIIRTARKGRGGVARRGQRVSAATVVVSAVSVALMVRIRPPCPLETRVGRRRCRAR